MTVLYVFNWFSIYWWFLGLFVSLVVNQLIYQQYFPYTQSLSLSLSKCVADLCAESVNELVCQWWALCLQSVLCLLTNLSPSPSFDVVSFSQPNFCKFGSHLHTHHSFHSHFYCPITGLVRCGQVWEPIGPGWRSKTKESLSSGTL